MRPWSRSDAPSRCGEATLLSRLSAAVDELVHSSEYREIYSRWHGEEPSVWTTGRILASMAIGLGLLALVVALARYRLLQRHAHELERRSEERDRAEAALAESEARYRLIVETSWEGIWTIDAQARTLFVNARMAEMLGSSPEELVGRNVMDFVPEELIERAETLAARRRDGKVDLLDFRLKRPDGDTLDVMMTQSPIFENGRYCGALTMVTDVSERRRLEEELRRSQAHEAQGRLAGFVAHDLNNLLAVINSALIFVRQALPEDHPALAETVPIAEASERAASLTSRLLAYSKQQVLQARRFSPSRRIAESEVFLRRLCGPAIELTILAPESPALVQMDAIQFDQVVLNLVANARDASPAGGRIRVSVEELTLSGPGSQTEHRPAPGDYVLLSIRDEGEGMSDEALEHAFVPLFTTKTAGGGSGLGLAACRTIVTSAGGRIVVGSSSPSGTEMLVYLPRVGDEEPEGGEGGVPPAAGAGLERAGSLTRAGSVARTASLTRAGPATTRSESSASTTPRAGRQSFEVLLVEDEPDIRSLLARFLVQHGHAVSTAASADEALTLLQGSGSGFDRLVTDVLLPGTSGLELGRRLLGEDERLRVVYISGFPAASLDELGQLGPRERFVSKPFTPQQVLAALED